MLLYLYSHLIKFNGASYKSVFYYQRYLMILRIWSFALNFLKFLSRIIPHKELILASSNRFFNYFTCCIYDYTSDNFHNSICLAKNICNLYSVLDVFSRLILFFLFLKICCVIFSINNAVKRLEIAMILSGRSKNFPSKIYG